MPDPVADSRATLGTAGSRLAQQSRQLPQRRQSRSVGQTSSRTGLAIAEPRLGAARISLIRGIGLRACVTATFRATASRSHGTALDRFIDEDCYRALDALNGLRESSGFRRREGHMRGLRLAPLKVTRANPRSLWPGTTTASRPGVEFGHPLAEPSPR